MTPQKQVSPDYPWLMPEVIDWLSGILKPHMTVLETGSGGSTVFFAERVHHLISYEHHDQWFETVRGELIRRHLIDKVHMHLSPGYPQRGLAIVEPLDVVLIDGRGRVKSAIDAWVWVKPGGWLILDDARRQRYCELLLAMDNECAARMNNACAARIEFRGTPYSDELSTLAWRKR